MTTLPDFRSATFEPNAPIDNQYFPRTLGSIFAYEAEKDGEVIESNQVFTTFETKEILGVPTVVVRDVAWDQGVLVEDTFDWYAQDTEGNVWYMGETATNYEYDDAGNFIGTNNEGSWEAGVDGALPGFLMEAKPQVGDNYFQEFAPGIAEDQAEVISLNESVSIGLGDFDNVLKTRDFTELQPEVFEFKYYAPGVGQILADEGITEAGGEPELSPELVEISTLTESKLPALGTTTFESSAEVNNPYFPLDPGMLYVYEEEIDSDTGETELERQVFVTDETKNILGITTRVVQDREFVHGVLTEDTFAYYAQDTEGNVWLLGESSTEYKYDNEGNLTNTDDSDSWVAGVDQNLPGFIALGSPDAGDAYYQRFQIGEEQDQVEVVDVDESLSIDFGNFEDVLQVREFSDLDPNEFDLTYYAPGIGQVLQEEFDEDGEVVLSSELVGVFNTNNSLQHVDVNAAEVAYMDVYLAGSGAITEVSYAQPFDLDSQTLVGLGAESTLLSGVSDMLTVA